MNVHQASLIRSQQALCGVGATQIKARYTDLEFIQYPKLSALFTGRLHSFLFQEILFLQFPEK